MSHIFISYASEDRSRAERLAAALQRHGWPVWSDREIPPGKTFDQVIEEALDAAKCVIVLWSKQSVTSNWVKSEASEGLRRGVLVPALIDDVRIPLQFSRIQAARLVDWEGESAHPEFAKLVKAVQPILGQPLRTEAEQVTLGETPEACVTVVEPEKEPVLAREPASPPDELPVDTPRSERTAGIFHGFSVQKVLFLLIGVTFLAATFWILQGPDRVIQLAPTIHSPARTVFQENRPTRQAPDRVALKGKATKPSEPPQPTVLRAPSPTPSQPIVSKVSPPKPSEPPVASVPAPTVTRKVRSSLDNTKIAFGSDRYGVLEINVVNIDGTKPRRMTGTLDRQPAWSPGGKRIAFVSNRDGNREIYVMNADGTNPNRLTNNPAFDGHPSWSPNGTKIAFESYREHNYDIYVMNADGSNPSRLTKTPWDDESPAWSPFLQ
jgi:hypothetical protein